MYALLVLKTAQQAFLDSLPLFTVSTRICWSTGGNVFCLISGLDSLLLSMAHHLRLKVAAALWSEKLRAVVVGTCTSLR